MDTAGAKFQVFMEGVEVPFLSFHTTSAGGGMSGVISLPPITSAYNLKANTHVAIFYKFSFDAEYLLLCDGYLTTRQGVRPNQSVAYSFEGVGSRTKYIPYDQVDVRYAALHQMSAKLPRSTFSELVTRMTERTAAGGDPSVTNGIREFVKSIVSSGGTDTRTSHLAKLDSVTVDYLVTTKLASRYRVSFDDSFLSDVGNAKLVYDNILAKNQGQQSSNNSINYTIRSFMRLISYNQYEQFSPTGGLLGNIDILPQLITAIPPKCNILTPTSFTMVENIMAAPTRTIMSLGNMQKTKGIPSKPGISWEYRGYPKDILTDQYTLEGKVLLESDEIYKGAVANPRIEMMVPVSGILKSQDPEKDVYQLTTEYFHELSGIGANAVPSVNLPMFDPMILAGVPAIIFDPVDKDHIVGTVQSITHSYSVGGVATTSVGLEYCFMVESQVNTVNHPWIKADIANPATLGEEYAKLGSEILVNTSSFDSVRDQLSHTILEMVKKGHTDLDLYKSKRKKGVITGDKYRSEVTFNQTARKEFVTLFKKEFDEIAIRGSKYYGISAEYHNKI